MTVILGTLAVSDPSITLEDWVVTAVKADDGTRVAKTELTVAANSSSQYGIICQESVDPVYVVASAKASKIWKPETATYVGELIVPSSGDPFLYKAISADPVPEDPLWSHVVFRAVLANAATCVDDKGHTMTLKAGAELYFNNEAPVSDKYTTSAYIDGGYCNLTVVGNGDFDMGTGDFTIEFWVKATSVTYATKKWIFALGDPSTATGIGLRYSSPSFGDRSFEVVSNNTVVDILPGYFNWAFISIDRISGEIRARMNGSNSEPIAIASQLAGDLFVGRGYGNADPIFYGGLYDFRVTKGVARHSSDYSVPTTTTVSIGPAMTGLSEPTWTQTLNDEFIDGSVTWGYVGSAPKPVVEGWLVPSRSIAAADTLSANVVFLAPLDSDRLELKGATIIPGQEWNDYYAQVASPLPPAGGNGVGSFMHATSYTVNDFPGIGYSVNGTSLALGAGDFTIEVWAKILLVDQYDWYSLFDIGDMTNSEGVGLMFKESTLQFEGWVSGYAYGTLKLSATPINGNTETDWHHVALSRQSGMMKLFVDGVGSGEVSVTNSLNPFSYGINIPQNIVTVGGDSRWSNSVFPGYLCDARITKGIARYWNNFTRPASRFTTY